MRIQGWKIDRYGVLGEYVVQDLPKGLVVFQGPNESGKSTLLAFLRCMLFGFSGLRGHRRRKNLYPALGEGRHGGTLNLQTEEGSFILDREVAQKKFHLTAREAGELAKKAGAKQMTIFHFSPRYMGKEGQIYQEAVKAFGS